MGSPILRSSVAIVFFREVKNQFDYNFRMNLVKMTHFFPPILTIKKISPQYNRFSSN